MNPGPKIWLSLAFSIYSSAEDIVGASACLQEWSHFSPNPWLPVVDAGFLKEPFIPGHPFEVIAKGKINKLPIIFGSTLDEGEGKEIFSSNQKEWVPSLRSMLVKSQAFVNEASLKRQTL